MDSFTFYSLLVSGFTLGMLHALDADHIMAVTVLSQEQKPRSASYVLWRVIANSMWWALGHGAILFAVVAICLLTGWRLPSYFSDFAELIVGLMLIAIGGWIWWQIVVRKISLKAHRHDGTVHLHLVKTKQLKHNHKPVLVGLTHGLAGSAPMLALLPALSQQSQWLPLLYIALFCVGVLICMVSFGLAFGLLQGYFMRLGQHCYQWMKMAVATASIILGGYWVLH